MIRSSRRAWVGLADALALLTHYSEVAVAGATDEARAAAQKALTVDPRLGAAYASLGLIAETEWKWDEAEDHFARALQLSPAYVPGLHWFSQLLSRTGRPDESLEVMGRALELDPLSLPVHMAMGVALNWAGRVDEALEVYDKAIQLDPGFAPIYVNVAGIAMTQERFEDALEAMTTVSRLYPERMPPDLVEAARTGYSARGARGFWEGTLEALAPRAADSKGYVYFGMAEACAQLGRIDEAFDHLERVIATRHPVASQLVGEPPLTPLRDDPRFAELKRKVGFR